MNRDELEGLDREALVVRAEASGIRRARILTRPELIDELLRRELGDETQLKKARGFFGRARDLVARVVERGLHLPDAAERIRWTGQLPPAVPRVEPQAMPTVTLAEIYAAQGHKSKAVDTLRRVLEREPDHGAARALLARLEDVAYVSPEPPLPPEPEVEPPHIPPEEDEAEDEAPLSRVEPRADAADADDMADVDADDEIESAPVTESDEVDAESSRRIPSAPPAPLSTGCVAIPVSPTAMFVVFHVEEAALERALFVHPDAAVCLRAVIVTPSWDGPSTEVRDIEVEGPTGELVLRDLPEPSVVRVAVGVRVPVGMREFEGDGPSFLPIAHSPALEFTGAAPEFEPESLARWTLQGLRPVSAESNGVYARALAGARRLAESVGAPDERMV